jgi:TRAP-type C4-dicarboxylate transport system substrate-binding protein
MTHREPAHRRHAYCNRAKIGFVVSAFAFAAFSPSNSQAQQQLKLTIVSGNPPTFTAIAAAIEGFIPKVDEILAKSGKYKITWVQGWSGSIVKPRGELEGIQTGLGDVGVVPGPFFPDKLSLFQIGYNTPFTSKDLDVVTAGMNDLLAKVPAMAGQGEKFNQIILKAAGVADNYVIFSKREIKGFADLKGMKIAAVGANQPWVAAAGATPVATELATQFNAYQTGVFEGIVMWQQAYTAFRMCELGAFRLDTDFGAVSPILLTVNKDSWGKLPDEVKAAFREAASTWAFETDRRIKTASNAGRQRCEKENNLKVTSLSAEDRRAWAMAMPNVAQNWAKREDAAGLPGSKMLATWMDYMREKKQPIVRHWDRE